MTTDRKYKEDLTIDQLIDYHKDFMRDKTLEGLAPCTVNGCARVIETSLNWIHRNNFTSKNNFPYPKSIKVFVDRIHPL